ncbi:hypothetical protein [Acinetobacter sp. 243_ASPC]|uniref:hypothetical protein n=1 Tax=Acinetobacter sp. 243_ASPC TaxID=1579345 RepID=UPI00065FFE16|nr:hypothetical protein [Acinetobacter sp. 243_ASPC]
MDPNSETQDNVENTATENNGEAVKVVEPIDGEGHQESGEGAQPQEGEQPNQEAEKPKKSRAQERIEKTTRENADLKRRLAEYEAKQNTPKANDKPKIEEFETYEEFQEKLGEWQVEEAMRRLEEKQGKKQAEQTQSQKQAEFQGAIDSFAETASDFDEVVTAGINRGLPMPITLDEVAAEFGYDANIQVRLLYELAKDEEFHELVSGSSKLKAARLLSERADSFAKKETPKIPNAPKPINPTKGNAPLKRDPESMSDKEFLKSRGL